MKVRVIVSLKPGVLDPQGRAIQHAIVGQGHAGVRDARAGKVIDLDLDDGFGDAALEDIAARLLANPVIEDYRIERLPGPAA